MFSFFKKKQAPALSPDRAAESPPASAADPALPASSERQRGKLDWLNADVGELFFGKKPASPVPNAPAVTTTPQSPPEAASLPPAAPVGAPPPVVPSVPPPVTAVPQATPPADVEQPAADRAGWMTKLRSGLQRTGGAIAGAFIGAEIG